jgi:virulence factor
MITTSGATDPVRVAVVGAGALATRVHYPSLSDDPMATIVGICDLDQQRLQAAGERFGVEKLFTDYRTMIETVAPEAVYVIGQPEFMYGIWCWCLAQGLDLFVEKPLGLTLHQATNLAYLAEANNCITQVGFQRRASPLLRHAQAALADRGPTTHAICSFYKCQPDPMLGARDHMMDDGVHAIDTLRAVCGGEVVDIHSVTRRIGTPDINFFTAQLVFDTGATGMLINSWTSGRRIFTVDLHVPGACAELDLEGVGHIYTDGDTTGTKITAQQIAGSEEFYVFGGFREKTSQFLQAVRSRKQPPSHFGDALKTMQIAEKILHQSLAIS